MTGAKNKTEIGLLEMIKSMKNKDLQQAKLPQPFYKIVDFLRFEIKNRNQIFLMMKDFSLIREREKA